MSSGWWLFPDSTSPLAAYGGRCAIPKICAFFRCGSSLAFIDSLISGLSTKMCVGLSGCDNLLFLQTLCGWVVQGLF